MNRCAQGEPLGAVLAGGRGRRIGGAKAKIALGGRPLISYPLRALRAVVADVAIVAKPGTELPELGDPPGVRVLREPAEPSHPLVGIVHALRAADGRPVLVCAADLPFVTPALLASLAAELGEGVTAVVAAGPDGALQPLLACYAPEAAELLAPAARAATAPLRAAVAELTPRTVRVRDPELLFNVNDAADLARAEARLAGRPTRT